MRRHIPVGFSVRIDFDALTLHLRITVLPQRRPACRCDVRRLGLHATALSGTLVRIWMSTSLDAFFGSWSLQGSPLHLYLDWVSRSLSPYQFNPLDINPLRELLDPNTPVIPLWRPDLA